MKILTAMIGEKYTYSTEFFKGYSSITIFICIYYGFVYNLLQLGIFEIVPNHHFQNLEKLPIGNITIFVHVIDAKSNYQEKRKIQF